MKKIILPPSSIVLLVFVVFQFSNGQGLLLKNYTTQDGLPDSRVAPILQDRDGYMWFGTQAGITRYDGQKFVNFSQAKEIPGIFARCICQDSSGAIWFGYSGFYRGGLMRIWNGGIVTFSGLNSPFANNVNSVVEDRHRDVWVSGAGGLNRIHFTNAERTSWSIDSFPNYPSGALYIDSKGILWIGSDRVYSYYNGELHDELRERGYSGDFGVRSYAIYESPEGELWAGGFNGALCLKDGGVKFYSTAEGLPERGVWAFQEDRQGNFWVGTMNGLYRRVSENGEYRFRRDESFGDAVVYDISLDREGNVWFASAPGVRKLIAGDFILDFPGKEMLSKPGIGPIEQDEMGTIYFGSRNTGLYRLQESQLVREPVTTLTITSMLAETPRKIWLGTWRGGVVLKNHDQEFVFGVQAGLPSSAVHALAKERDGSILIGTAAGICRLDPEGRVHKLAHPAIDTLTIFDIKEFSSCPSCPEDIWLATQRGVRLVRLSGDSLIPISLRWTGTEGRDAIVYEILADREHRLWLATDGSGLIEYDGKALRQYTTNDGLVGDRVFALAQDSLGQIWVGTSSGLSQFDGTSFRNFMAGDGFNEIGIHGLMVDRAGDLWVSSFPGVTKLRPQRLYHSGHHPPIYITGIQADTTLLKPAEPFELAPGVAAILFRYAGLSFTDETNIRYKYKLEGYDRSWSPPVKGREVRYTHLPAGSYTFNVLARNSEGVWSTHPALASFSVLPPVWQRWWFVAACAGLTAAGVYAAYRYRLNKLLEIERTRSRIAMDLHDDIGSSLTRISVMTEVAKRKATKADVEQTEYLNKIGETARALIDSLGDIVWSVDPKNDDLQNVIRRIVQFGQETCEGSQMTFETEILGSFDETRLPLQKRRDIYLVFKEAIHNIVQHSEAGSVRFSVHSTRNGALLEIIDDGIGFSMIQGEGDGDGLRTMRIRGERAGGHFNVSSTPNQGSRISLEVKTG